MFSPPFVLKYGMMKRSKSKLLDKKSRVERLREIVARIAKGEQFSAFDLMVQYDISLNVIYRDVSTLKKEGLISESWAFARKVR